MKIVTVHLPAFNSLSRDHGDHDYLPPPKRHLSTPSLGITPLPRLLAADLLELRTFQLPLSGSQQVVFTSELTCHTSRFQLPLSGSLHDL